MNVVRDQVSCLLVPDHFQEHLNSLGLKPIEPLARRVIDLFGPFDLIPAPENELLAEETSTWTGSYTEDYELPIELRAASARTDQLRTARQHAGSVWEEVKPTTFDDEATDATALGSTDEEKDRIHRLTDAVTWLHARGEGSPSAWI